MKTTKISSGADSSSALLTRREAASRMLMALGGAAAFVACGGTDSNSSGANTGTAGNDAGGSSGNPSGSTTTDGGATSWATGGTKAMTAVASYPDPFVTPAAACVLATAATEGPCTEAADQVRQDVSEGYDGLPMRLALRVVDSGCNPIPDAKVKIWHTQINGSYSGNTPNNGMCLKDSADAQKHYFRGAQTTDADGRVDFDSCFPGWYRGRTVHIHFSVTANGRTFTSQLVFEQSLVASIFAEHPAYVSFGAPDTTNTTDNVVGRGDLSSYTLTTARMSDGAMLASKQLVVS